MGCFYGVHAHFRHSDATNDELDASESVEDGEECAVCRSDECVLGGTMVHGPTAAFTISKSRCGAQPLEAFSSIELHTELRLGARATTEPILGLGSFQVRTS
ncbi:hypothetical protein GUJ93_ZPchr0012g19924 [Zizania palustris]|uniref:Uncharacterized protein n=1 Tax=Zizania palustris TaxID=103762 RepID=A0A8J6BTU4_ZIZPA|nr:hypothetical protein GUJ93_ZPchr0012g19924 [Zizania palustris]